MKVSQLNEQLNNLTTGYRHIGTFLMQGISDHKSTMKTSPDSPTAKYKRNGTKNDATGSANLQ